MKWCCDNRGHHSMKHSVWWLSYRTNCGSIECWICHPLKTEYFPPGSNYLPLSPYQKVIRSSQDPPHWLLTQARMAWNSLSDLCTHASTQNWWGKEMKDLIHSKILNVKTKKKQKKKLAQYFVLLILKIPLMTRVRSWLNSTCRRIECCNCWKDWLSSQKVLPCTITK